MTRRIVAYTDPITGKTYKTPEFNGDKSELLRRKSLDSCDMDWPDIMELFSTVTTLDIFIGANEKAQQFYHPFLDDVCPEPVAAVRELDFANKLAADEIIKLNF